MTEHKRSPISDNQGCLTSIASKRHKAELSISTKERKEKIGERVAALQQLVSPYGKTDTASVLHEAMDYIRFLHEQVKNLQNVQDYFPQLAKLCPVLIQVLSAPYLQSIPAAKMQDLEQYNLRSRGLCIVPISFTVGVARSNGADIWAPIKTSSPKF